MRVVQSQQKAEVTRTRRDMILVHAANVSSGATSQPPPPPHHVIKQDQEDNASGLSRGNSSASSHAPNGVGLPAESTNGYMPMLYSAGPGAQQQPNLTSSYTPLPDKVRGPLCGLASIQCEQLLHVLSLSAVGAFGGLLIDDLVAEPAPVNAQASALA